jgi:hypothetical protein
MSTRKEGIDAMVRHSKSACNRWVYVSAAKAEKNNKHNN